MPRFAYKAYNDANRPESGEIAARDERLALSALTARGLTPFEIAPLNGQDALRWWQREVHLFGDAVPRAALADFFSALALLLRANIPLLQALTSVLEEVEHRRLRSLLNGAHAEVAEGGRLADALDGRAELVPARFVSLIAVGEETNKLAETLSHAADLAAREERTRRELSSALTYPAILLLASILILGALVFLLAPTLVPVFKAVKSEPPIAIQAMMSLRSFVLEMWGPILIGGGGLSLGAILAVRAGLVKTAGLRARLPIIGRLLIESDAARALSALQLLLASGAPLPSALRVAGAGANSTELRSFFDIASDHVTSGGRLGDCLEPDLLTPMACQMIRMGEQSNRLPEMLLHAATKLEARVAGRLRRLIQVLTPALTLGIGLIVGLLIYTTLSAVLDINDLALK